MEMQVIQLLDILRISSRLVPRIGNFGNDPHQGFWNVPPAILTPMTTIIGLSRCRLREYIGDSRQITIRIAMN